MTDAPKNDDLTAEDWTRRIDDAMAAERAWRDKGKEVVLIYRAEKTANGSSGRGRFNMLFANTSILAPAVYQQAPQADVRRRFSRPDPLADDASAIVQGALNASFEVAGLDGEIKRMIADVLLPGRGVIRVRWVPVVRDQPSMGPDGQPQIDDKGQPVTAPQKVWESLEFEHVFWQDFICEPCRRWSSCAYVAFRHYLTKAEMRAEFGDDPAILAKLEDDAWSRRAFTHSPSESSDLDTKRKDATEPRAMVWECWDKSRRVIDWIVPGQSPQLLRRDEDALELQGFYPCPAPLLSISTTDSMIPVPEYEIYRDLAAEVSSLTERIDAIVKRMKVSGMFNGSIEELADVLDGADGQMVPIAAVEMQQAMSASVWMMPLDMLATTAVALYSAREQSKQALYEVTGISDILRGASVAGETATAQRIKGNFGTLRIDDRRRSLAANLKQLVLIAAEIMASKFAATTLSMMTGREVPPEVEAYLRNEARLMCQVDVETDSTIAADQSSEQEAATQLVQAIGGVINVFGPLVQQKMAPVELVTEMLKLVLKPFKGSRDVLDIISQMADQSKQQSQQPAAPPEPTPEQQAAQADAQIKAQQAQQDMQIAQQRFQMDQAKAQQDMAIDRGKFELETRKVEAQIARPTAQPARKP